MDEETKQDIANSEEAGSTETSFSFSKALEFLKEGKKVFRANWNGKGQYLELQMPDKNSKMTLPYIYLKTVDGYLVPWLASQTDLLSDDWLEYTTAKEFADKLPA